MLTKVVWTCVAVAAVIAGGIFYYTHHSVVSTVVEQEIRDNAPDYSSGLKYPFFIGVNHEQDLNAALKALVLERLSDFKTIVRRRNPSGRAMQHKSGLYTEYTMIVFNPQLVTVRLKITSYITGDQHPVTTLETFSYDLVNNAMIPEVIL